MFSVIDALRRFPVPITHLGYVIRLSLPDREQILRAMSEKKTSDPMSDLSQEFTRPTRVDAWISSTHADFASSMMYLTFIPSFS